MIKKSNLKFISIITIAIFVFNFSFSQAEETTTLTDEPASETAPAEEPTDTQTAPVEEETSSEPILTEEPADASVSADEAIENNSANESEEENQADESGPVQSQDLPEEPVIGRANDQQAATSSPDLLKIEDLPTSGSLPASESLFTQIGHEVITGIIRSLDISNLSLVAQWQMLGQKADGEYSGEDDSPESGAQILPSGQYQVNKAAAICALVADTVVLDSSLSVKAAINYPKDIAKSETALGEKTGCGQLKSEITLTRLGQDEGVGLVCDEIRNSNNNLITWNYSNESQIAYSFEQVCGLDGYLAKQTAAVFCGEIELSYDDPAGEYQARISAQNNNSTKTLENKFQYLELTNFENDFSQVQYGLVKLNEWKLLTGDLVWGNSGLPTVRNTGNTRLQIRVAQNDFGLGKTGDQWNIAYQARVGEKAIFTNYFPEEIAALKDYLELGQSAKVDFGALITKFPETSKDAAFAGTMTLTGEKVEGLKCQ